MPVTDFTANMMFTRIQEELHRSAGDATEDLQVWDAIVSAVEHYKHHRFWFNEEHIEFTTTDGTDTYSGDLFTHDNATAGFDWDRVLQIDQLMYNLGSWRYELTRWPWERIEREKATTSHKGYPDHFAIGRDSVRLYPIPNTTGHKIEGRVLKDISQVHRNIGTNDDYTDAWFTHGEELIRNRAKKDLCLSYYDDDAGARRAANMEALALQSLKEKTEAKYHHREEIVPYY